MATKRARLHIPAVLVVAISAHTGCDDDPQECVATCVPAPGDAGVLADGALRECPTCTTTGDCPNGCVPLG